MRAHHIKLAAVSKLFHKAFDKSNYNDYNKLKLSTMRSLDNAFLWFLEMELEVNLFMFIGSVLEGNFNLFV